MWQVSYRDLRIKCKLKLGERHSSLNQIHSGIILIVEQTLKSVFGEDDKNKSSNTSAPTNRAEALAMKNKFMGVFKKGQ